MRVDPVVYDTDVLVIGSGISGALVSKHLVASGLKVTIIEAGSGWTRGKAFDQFVQNVDRSLDAPYPKQSWLSHPGDNNYFGERGGAYRPHFIQGVGGTTWSWTAITPRFLPSDFNLFSRYGVGENWPIGYDDLEPYYTLAEYEMGVSGDSLNHHGSPRSKDYPMQAMPMSYADKVIAKQLQVRGLRVAPFPAARNTMAYDNRPPCQGNNTCATLCPTGASYSANIDIAKAQGAGARLITNAVVYRLEVDKQRQISNAYYKRPDGSTQSIRARQYVMACNAFETPRLLLMSAGDDCPEGVANSSGQVGCNLMDHALFTCDFRMPEPLYIGRGPQSISTILHGRDGVFRRDFAAAKFFLSNDLNVHQETSKLLADERQWRLPQLGLKESVVNLGKIGFEVEQLPLRTNKVSINNQRFDAMGLPVLDVNYKLASYTERGLDYWKGFTFNLLKSMKAEEVGHNISLSSHHAAGTTKMGHDPSQSVVNKHGQSHDHNNLFIVGGSVFPTQGTANPTLTMAALSLRLADYIKRIKY